MLKSRRGLLAAGLAVAVVGAMGVASTMNAGAEEIPDSPSASSAPTNDQNPEAATESTTDSDASPAVDVTPVNPTPPAVLPWGARPHRISRGRAGASSQSLRTAGQAAAPADTSGATVAEPEYAPKGSTSPADDSKVQPADVPPLPAATPSVPVTPPPTRAPSGKSGVNFTYSGGFQAAETDGIYANVTIAKPKLDKSDFHTLGEIALESADDPDNPGVRQIVEVGWNVDRSVNNDDDPHLFVYHWVNGQSTCYNGCGFVQFSSSVKPGDTLSYGVTKKIGVQYAGGAWWIAFDSEWVGYFPEKLWNDAGVKFSRSGLLQVFGEVASPDQPSCATQMGTGVTPVADTDNAAKMASVSYLNGPAVVLAPVVNLQARFPMVALSARTIAYGGGTPPLASAKVGSAQLTVC